MKATSSPDAEGFIEEVRGDGDPDLAGCLRIEERELDAGARNFPERVSDQPAPR